MGMFDDIDVPFSLWECPYCGAELSDWQSKDGPCVGTSLQFFEVDNFYTSCTSCNRWVEYVYRGPERIIDDYILKEIK